MPIPDNSAPLVSDEHPAHAASVLAAFNRATNRLIAGTRFALLGTADAVAALTQIVHGMGGHTAPTAESDVLILIGALSDDQTTDALGWLSAEPATEEPRLPIIVDAAGALRDAASELAQRLTATDRVLPDGLRAAHAPRGNIAIVDAATMRTAPHSSAPTPDNFRADRGSARIDWAASAMPVTRELASRLARSGAVRGVRIGVVLVLEPKTAVLAIELTRAGADVRVFAPANEVDPDAAAALRARGIVVLGSPDATADEDAELALDLVRWQPQLLIDDGAHLIRLVHEHPEALAELRGAAEETTSGVRPLRTMARDGALAVPVIPVNDARVKTLFDNRYGTGQTCVFAIADVLDDARNTGISTVDPLTATWLVLGYGPVGEGVCRHARALGARVVVAEIDPVRALAAEVDGFEVMTTQDAARQADIIVSATGVRGTIDDAVIRAAAPRAIIAIAGGTDGELDAPGATWTDRAPQLSELTLGDQRVLVLAHGHGVNYTAGGGNPIEIMDLSFAAQVAAIEQLTTAGVLTESSTLATGLHDLEREREDEIAHLALSTRRHAAASAPPRSPATTAKAPAPERSRYSRIAAMPPTAEAADTVQATVTVYSASLVIPVTAPRIRDGAIAVRGDRILHVGERRWVLQSLRDAGIDFVEEHWDGVITPGLVNAHTHLQYTRMADVATRRYAGFDDWAAAFDAVYDRDGAEHDWSAAAADGARLAVASGTTALADVVTDREAVSALHDTGLHGIAYWEVMGWSNADWRAHGRDAAIADLDSMPASPGVGVSPHAPYSLEVQPLLDIPDVVRNRGMRLHIHLAEAHIENENVESDDAWVGLNAESFRALRSQGVGVSSTQFVDQLGVLGPDCHIAHGIYMTGRDRSLLRARGTSVALCPRSNDVIGLDAPPVAAYLREGNLICVGTDSLSSSQSLDPLADVAQLHRIAREQGYADSDLHQRLFHAVTLGGAHALGLGTGTQRVGQLAVGALADLAFFTVDDTAPREALSQLVEAGEGTCRRTIVAGQTVFHREER
ncbi:adenosylhomocysteinase [Microbacterium sp. MPKO10]|uniref:adenosylhomocysteinase n=1 Tax=Microbacterium sp. MPKO10 TaxID=2989818 RepID=UPI0022356062|nr:adenosylhomocysteinase [Microbacterium sp. MPKO10]MCW4457663.1 adenosylhomocysteinase [Microbacterium sp. MPKO10]